MIDNGLLHGQNEAGHYMIRGGFLLLYGIYMYVYMFMVRRVVNFHVITIKQHIK